MNEKLKKRVSVLERKYVWTYDFVENTWGEVLRRLS